MRRLRSRNRNSSVPRHHRTNSPRRLAIIAESFQPYVNGVSNSVLRLLDYCEQKNLEAQESGHPPAWDVIVLAPGKHPRHTECADSPELLEYGGFPIYRFRAVKFPRITSLPVGLPSIRMVRIVKQFRPTVVHVASPFFLGAAGLFVATSLKIPSIGVFQTDIAGYSTQYRLGFLEKSAWRWTRIFLTKATKVLVPSTAAQELLETHKILGSQLWGRGVDTTLFHPGKRSETLRQEWSGSTQRTLVGIVARLAPEKAVYRLECVDQDPRMQVVVIGDGPERESLERQLPNALFTGVLTGEALAQAYASCDVIVTAGEFETFGQVVQEAHASGIPVIAPAAGGPIDLVAKGTGVLLPVDGFAQQLPDAVRSIVDSENYRALRKNSRACVEDKTWPDICAQLEQHYSDVEYGRLDEWLEHH